MPFVTAGDPDLDFTAAVLQELVKRGASLCELGIPYSDPIADGPVIQASYTHALAHKVKLQQILKMAESVVPKLAAPVVTMVSYAIVYRHGVEQYVKDCQRRESPERLCQICSSKNRSRWRKSAVLPISA